MSVVSTREGSHHTSLVPRIFAVTPRELEVLAAIVRCGGEPYAAKAIGISLSTVKGHAASVRRKLEVPTTLVAVVRLWNNPRLQELIGPESEWARPYPRRKTA